MGITARKQHYVEYEITAAIARAIFTVHEIHGKIHAVKLVKEIADVTLVDAKEIYETFIPQYRTDKAAYKNYTVKVYH